VRILLYEFVTGGGWYLQDPAQAPSGSLLAEGRAMRDSLAADLAAIDGCEVSLLHDVRLPQPTAAIGKSLHWSTVASAEEHQTRLLDAGSSVDAAILIAPEFNGHLLSIARSLDVTGTKLLSPSVEFIEVAANKQATAARLDAAGVPVPMGCLTSLDMLHFQPHLHFPCVLKPNDGAGSEQVTLLRTPDDIPSHSGSTTRWRMEEFIEGTAASVALLCGPTPLPCPACYQLLSNEGQFRYLGGRRIQDRSLAQRAQTLALRALAAMPPAVGYVGVDLVLGHAADGSEDAVIEINPRLTTSYIGLRQLAPSNLAEAMLNVAAARTPLLSWIDRTIQFESDGTCHQA